MPLPLARLAFLGGLILSLHAEDSATWTFTGNTPNDLASQGKVAFTLPGPRRPDYPAFDFKNTAAHFAGKGDRLVLQAPATLASLTFRNGDAITIEAWVKPEGQRQGSNVYLIGKGRTKAGSSNQNWALRLREMYGTDCPSFLFSTNAQPQGAGDTHWHRWTTVSGLPTDGRWHHVAISYLFGKPDSIRGYVDGQEIKGAWDMGGASTEAPVADNDQVWLGSSMGGSAANSFIGLLDEVKVHRSALPSATLRQRYVTTLPALVVATVTPRENNTNAGNDTAPATTKSAQTAPDIRKAPTLDWSKVSTDSVTVELCEQGLPEKNTWPMQAPNGAETYSAPAFGFFRTPEKYIDTGVRADRGNPYLLRAYALTKLPAGKHRLLLRGRGAAALFIDGKLILSTPFPPAGTDDKPIKAQDKFLNLDQAFRFSPPGNREVWVEFTSSGAAHQIILETIVGYVIDAKKRRRPELGETVAAVSFAGTQQWQLLAAGSPSIDYTDAGWSDYERTQNDVLDRRDEAARASARASQADYWQKRRVAAQAWLASTPEVAVPTLAADGSVASNAIDAFLSAKLVAFRSQQGRRELGGIDFFRQIFPLFEGKCFECHQGGKVKGGLHLDTREGALKGGKSDGPALTPGNPATSALLARIRSHDIDEQMPPKGPRVSAAEAMLLEQWIKAGADWPEIRPTTLTLSPLTTDLAFLRRVTLDTVGVVPTETEIATYLADPLEQRRPRVIDRLLADPRLADHWMGYWQDVLAENPNILNPTLNNSGPFRWWLYESLRDHKPLDLMVTELVRLRGSERYGGPAGFGVASQNDVPLAAKATILTTAFLGLETKCARCHDAPAHSSKQEQVFALAALLATKAVTVPKTSSVPMDKLREGGRKPLIEVTLAPGTTVPPHWPFPEFCSESVADDLAQDPHDPRDRLAALLTAPQNERFAQVMANRLWARLMGRGIVEPVADWERGRATHPELLRWLGRELVRGDYAPTHLMRLVLNSRAYQRATDASQKHPNALYASPAPRRLSAEQIVDSLFAATGKPFRTEEVSLDIDGVRESDNSISLGKPRRAWMLASTSNERDRPSLSLPRVQAVNDVLTSFGWRSTRPDPLTDRDIAANALQPAIMSNGTVGAWLTVLSDDHGTTALALGEQPVEKLIDRLFLRMLTRYPTEAEQRSFRQHLSPGYEERKVDPKSLSPITPSEPRRPAYYVSWSNHLDKDATHVRQGQIEAARRGDPPTRLLTADWRRRLEDSLWALVNSPEFYFTP